MCTKHCSINQSETVQEAVNRVKTIKIYLSIAVQLLILIQWCSFNQSSFSSINSCFSIAWGGHLWGERKRLFNPFVLPKQLRKCKYFIRKIDLLWMQRKIYATNLIQFVDKPCAWAEPEKILKIDFFSSHLVSRAAKEQRNVLGCKWTLCPWVTELPRKHSGVHALLG